MQGCRTYRTENSQGLPKLSDSEFSGAAELIGLGILTPYRRLPVMDPSRASGFGWAFSEDENEDQGNRGFVAGGP